MKRKMTMNRARALLETPYNQLSDKQVQALADFKDVLQSRWDKLTEDDCAVASARKMEKKQAVKISGLQFAIDQKLMILGRVVRGRNDTLSAIQTLGDLSKWDLAAAHKSVLKKEWFAYRTVCQSHPWAVFGHHFQKRHAEKTPDERLLFLLEEQVGYRVPRYEGRHPAAQRAIDARNAEHGIVR